METDRPSENGKFGDLSGAEIDLNSAQIRQFHVWANRSIFIQST